MDKARIRADMISNLNVQKSVKKQIKYEEGKMRNKCCLLNNFTFLLAVLKITESDWWKCVFQVELRKKEQQLERQCERLSVSQRVIAEQEEELAEVAKELEISERENTLLRESMEKILEENNYGRFDTRKLHLKWHP